MLPGIMAERIGDGMGEEHLIASDEITSVVSAVKAVLERSRSIVAQQVNNELLTTYWNIGRIVCEFEQSNSARADYGNKRLERYLKN